MKENREKKNIVIKMLSNDKIFSTGINKKSLFLSFFKIWNENFFFDKVLIIVQ